MRGLLLALSLVTGGCGWLLGISDTPSDLDARAPDAQIGVDVMRDEFAIYDAAAWRGAKYCYNEPAGDYTPEAMNGRLLMRADDVCHGIIRSAEEWQPPFRVTIDAVAYLDSAGKNDDGAIFMLGQDWPLFGAERGAGLRVDIPPGEATLWTQAGGSNALVGNIEQGRDTRVTLELNVEGDLAVGYSDRTARINGALSPGRSQRLYISVMNSFDGVDLERVFVEQLAP